MALEPDRHREIIPTSYFATRNGENGRNEGGNGRNGRNEKMEEIVAETTSHTLYKIRFSLHELWHSMAARFYLLNVNDNDVTCERLLQYILQCRSDHLVWRKSGIVSY